MARARIAALESQLAAATLRAVKAEQAHTQTFEQLRIHAAATMLAFWDERTLCWIIPNERVEMVQNPKMREAIKAALSMDAIKTAAELAKARRTEPEPDIQPSKEAP